MKSILSNVPIDRSLSRTALNERVHRVMQRELTDLQREILQAYYFEQKNIPAIARERGVNKSSVCRALHRAERQLGRFLRY